jgi:hypothetical protein
MAQMFNNLTTRDDLKYNIDYGGLQVVTDFFSILKGFEVWERVTIQAEFFTCLGAILYIFFLRHWYSG